MVGGQLSAGRSMALSKHCKLWKPTANALVQSLLHHAWSFSLRAVLAQGTYIPCTPTRVWREILSEVI